MDRAGQDRSICTRNLQDKESMGKHKIGQEKDRIMSG